MAYRIMAKKPDGGQAFPDASEFGMSLRDYFAGQALIGILSETGSDMNDDVLSRRCYEIADAMLNAREA